MNENMNDAVEMHEAEPHHVETFRHADGSVTIVKFDPFPGDIESPRDHDGNVSILVQDRNGHFGNLERGSADAGLVEAWDRFDGDVDKVRRYVAAHRPDVLYVGEWSVTGSSQSDWAGGWGYVTQEAWDAAGLTDELTPEAAMTQEVETYAAWWSGEVYSVAVLTQGDPIVVYGDHGAYVDGHQVDLEEVYGFYAFDSHRAIVEAVNGSPII